MTETNTDRFLQARREIIAAEFSSLNDMQKKAVMATEGPLLLLAGAGSGKTTVLIHRVANLIRYGSASDSTEIPSWATDDDCLFLCDYAQHRDQTNAERAMKLCKLNPVMPWNIIAITFTNKAANELKSRLNTLLGEESDGIWAMTFHSACCRILRKNIDLLGYNSDFTIYDSADSEKLMKDIIKAMNFDEKSFPAKNVLSAISDAKDRMETPDEMMKRAKQSSDYRAVRIAEAYTEYQKRLKSSNALDFDDIILLTVYLLQNYDDVREYYQKKFKYVLIDEYQDTNNLQYLLASLLSGRYENICVVGDDDQSIYRFRGATIENILGFEQQYQGTRVIRLEQNYRSTGNILDAANAVIANNKGRKGKTLWTQKEKGDQLVVYEAGNEHDEATFVAARILDSVGRGEHFRDNAVLYRTNAQSNAIEMAFKQNGIPYRIIGGTRFFDRAEVKDVLAYLQIINNTTDDLRLRRIINTPTRGIGNKTIETAERQAAAAGIPLFDVISDPQGYPSLEKSAAKLQKFSEMILELRKEAEKIPLDQLYDCVLNESGYMLMLETHNPEENQSRKENVQELKSNIISYMEKNENPSLHGFLEEVSLYTDIEKYDVDADAAVMMTIHSAKGLEFPYVYLVGVEEGIFPGTKVLTDPSELEEERRLCYVAITRAEKGLFLSWARQRMLYGRTSYNRGSRFLSEIPQECVRSANIHRPAVQKQYERNSMQERIQKPRRTAFANKTTTSYHGYASREERAVLTLNKGDVVRHTVFGEGVVLNVLKMGGDALLEIAFDTVGTKKLMLNAASAHMTKK